MRRLGIVGAETFVDVATANLAVLELTSVQVTQLSEYRTLLADKWAAQKQARDNTKSATRVLITPRKEALQGFGYRAAAILANPGIPDELKLALGLRRRRTGAQSEPTLPANVRVEIAKDGTWRLKWGCGLSPASTRFAVEKRNSETEPWSLVTTVGGLSLKLTPRPTRRAPSGACARPPWRSAAPGPRPWRPAGHPPPPHRR